MMALVPVALIGWIPFVLLLFAVLPARRAAVATLMIGWLFLPEHWGRGYASEATLALANHGIRHLQLMRIEIIMSTLNVG